MVAHSPEPGAHDKSARQQRTAKKCGASVLLDSLRGSADYNIADGIDVVLGSLVRGTQRQNFPVVSRRHFYVIIVLFVQINGLFLNAKKNVSVRNVS